MMNKARIVVAGPFPPPVHGMAAVNAAVREHLEAAGGDLVVIDLAAPSLDRSFLARLRRLPKVLSGLVSLLTLRRLRGGTLYMSVSGGSGQIYEILFALVGRLRVMRLYLHHHSFAYLNRKSFLTRLLTYVAGATATHVALSQMMAARLSDAYGVLRVFPASNVWLRLTRPKTAVRPRDAIRALGFLSNVSREKGIFQFLDLVQTTERQKLSLVAHIAGPFQDAQTERKVHERLRELVSPDYLGPRYGADKDRFFEQIDVLVFPTSYSNEAEPLTILEALSRGIPVIAYCRGCIPEILTPECGKLIDPDEPFVPAALERIKMWMEIPSAFEAASQAAAKRFAQLYAENDKRWRSLLAEMLGSERSAVHAADKKETRPSDQLS